MTTLQENTKPIEVWLSQPNIQITCRVVFEDETATELGVDSLSMRGAQREMTAWLIRQGYEAVGRWTYEDEDQNEAVRQFKRPGLQRPLMNIPTGITRPLT